DLECMPVDEWLSRDLNQMSFQDRNKVYEEIHGVANLCPEETPELLHRSLKELERALEAIPAHKKTAFQEAQRLAAAPAVASTSTSTSPSGSHDRLYHYHQMGNSLSASVAPQSTSYINDADFRLLFLRTEFFDAQKAADRLVKFLDLIKTYYGVVALQRPIRLSDLGR
ncbi:MAG: hypothetical protein SGARI_004765, partial [Bacillariaceae sp.]